MFSNRVLPYCVWNRFDELDKYVKDYPFLDVKNEIKFAFNVTPTGLIYELH